MKFGGSVKKYTPRKFLAEKNEIVAMSLPLFMREYRRISCMSFLVAFMLQRHVHYKTILNYKYRLFVVTMSKHVTYI